MSELRRSRCSCSFFVGFHWSRPFRISSAFDTNAPCAHLPLPRTIWYVLSVSPFSETNYPQVWRMWSQIILRAWPDARLHQTSTPSGPLNSVAIPSPPQYPVCQPAPLSWYYLPPSLDIVIQLVSSQEEALILEFHPKVCPHSLVP